MDQVIIIHTSKSGQKKMWLKEVSQEPGSGELNLFVCGLIEILESLGENPSIEEFRFYHSDRLDAFFGQSI